MPRLLRHAVPLVIIGSLAGGGFGQDPDLARYFGFSGLEIIKIGRQAGPVAVADMNADGLNDLIAVNNRASRIELHLQRGDASPDDADQVPVRVNEFPEHWRFRRQNISVNHHVTSVVPYDFDFDGLMDLVYAGFPSELVFVRQREKGTFVVTRRHRVKNLAAGRDGLFIADILDDSHPELLGLVDGVINIWPLDRDMIGQPTELAAGEDIVAIVLEDFTGNGRTDVIGILPDDPAPVRLWMGQTEGGLGVIGAQVRFEMPPIRECTGIRIYGQAAANLATIERASKRMVLYEVATEQIEEVGNRDAAIRVQSFTDAGNRQRAHAVIDFDGDGLLDLVATDTESNAIVVYQQRPEKGLQRGRSHPSLSELTYLVAGNTDDDSSAELFVLSEREGIVGRCDVTGGDVPFPVPLSISAGRTPTALNLVELEDGPRAAIVAKNGRDYVLELVAMDGESEIIELGKLSRSPQTIIALDADQDGRTDLLLFTKDKPMTMLHATEEAFELTESDDMGQFGLIKAATWENTTVFDIDGDGEQELLIADKNYVRAVRYEPQPGPGVSPGWQVVEQINADDSSAKLVSLAILGDRIVAADKENDELIVMARSGGPAGRWMQTEALSVRGFSFSSIHAGAFSGDGERNLLAVGDDGFAVIRLAGERVILKDWASWRTTEERRVQHELAHGDVNGDGFTDLVSLDAGEQMCELFTLSEAGRLLYATGFQIFESKIFSGGDSREYEPSQVLIVDVTGDGGDDVVLMAHDRILIYPQSPYTGEPHGR